MLKKIIITVLVLVVVLGGVAVIYLQPTKPPQSQAFINGAVLTMDAENSIAEAVLIENDKIVAVGSNADIQQKVTDQTLVHDLAGKTLMPGFIDAHGHFPGTGINVFAADLNSPPIGNVRNIDEIIAALQAKAVNAPKDKWLLGYGYDDTMIEEKRHITKQELDAVFPDRPVFIWHISGHMAVINSKAFEVIGVDENTPDIEGGLYIKDAEGQLTGLLEETAALEPQLVAMDFGIKGSLDIIKAASSEYSRKGVTSAQSGALTEEMAAGMVMADKLQFIQQRLSLWPLFDEWGERLLNGEVSAEDFTTERVSVGPIKVIADGSIQGYTGYLSDPYYVQPKRDAHYGDSEKKLDLYRGYPRIPKDRLIDWISRYHNAGFHLAVHGNGDAAIDDIIEAFALAQQENPVADPRLILIHSQMAREDQLVKMKELGITPSFFTAHTYYWGDRHRDIFMGPERAFRMSPTKSALDLDLPFTIHLDAPIVPMDPLLGVWSTVNRLSTSGQVIGAEQRVSVMQALRATTIDAAWQLFQEDKVGSIEVGKLADLVVLDRNPLEHPLEIKDMQVTHTLVGGVTIYQQ